MSYDWMPERYRRRQPTCWDPPRTRRTTAYQYSSSYELDMYSPSPPRRRPTCWDPPVYRETPRQRPHTNDGDLDDMHHDDSVNTKLNRVIDCFDRFDSWREEIDRSFENLDPMVMRGSDEFYNDDEIEESEYDDQRRRRTGEINYWRRNQNFGARGSSPHDERGRPDGRSRRGPCWDPPGGRQSRWEPPPRRASRGYSDYDQPPLCLPSRSDRPRKPPPYSSRDSPNDSSAPPGHLCSAAPPPAAAAPPPLLHGDQQPSPSCCQPMTHLRQVGACLELPTTVQQPLLQRPPPLPMPRSDHPQQPSPPPPLELLPYSAPGPSQPLQPLPEIAPLLASNRLPSSRSEKRQTNLQIVDEYSLINKVVPCSHDVVGEKNIVEDKWKENEMGPKGLAGSKDEEDSYLFRMIKVIILRAFDPGICVSFSKRMYGFLAMQMEKSVLRENEKELPLEGVIKCLFAAAETFRIELHMLAKHVVFTNTRKFNGDDDGKRSTARCVFDPGGDASPRLLLSTLYVASWFPP